MERPTLMAKPALTGDEIGMVLYPVIVLHTQRVLVLLMAGQTPFNINGFKINDD